MSGSKTSAHPYIPNAAPTVKQEMLQAIGVDSIEELYVSIPQELRMTRELDLPPAFGSEQELARHMRTLLGKNVPTSEVLSFLGAGCFPHYVPAVCSEVNTRAEFLTAYAGEPYEDHGKWQAIFEYTSLMAELLEMDVVSVPNYDGYQAASTSLRMALRITGRSTVLVSEGMLPAKRAKIDTYIAGAGSVVTVPLDRATGQLDMDALRELLTPDVAGILVETPNAFGTVESRGEEIAALAHENGSVVVAAIDPLSVGYVESPSRWGADIICGDIQSLGLGMHYGGANGGFIAIHDEERFVFELPTRLFGLSPTVKKGELGFTDVAYERTSLAMREEGVEWVGTAAALWGITAGVYLSLMGPKGMTELGTTVAAYSRYAITQLSSIPGVEVLFADSPHWREVTVRYAGGTVAEVNAALLDRGVVGGADHSAHPANLGQVSTFCFTEVHSVSDIDRLVAELRTVLK